MEEFRVLKNVGQNEHCFVKKCSQNWIYANIAFWQLGFMSRKKIFFLSVTTSRNFFFRWSLCELISKWNVVRYFFRVKSKYLPPFPLKWPHFKMPRPFSSIWHLLRLKKYVIPILILFDTKKNIWRLDCLFPRNFWYFWHILGFFDKKQKFTINSCVSAINLEK